MTYNIFKAIDLQQTLVNNTGRLNVTKSHSKYINLISYITLGVMKHWRFILIKAFVVCINFREIQYVTTSFLKLMHYVDIITESELIMLEFLGGKI